MAQADNAPTTDCPAARLAREASRVILARDVAELADGDGLDLLEAHLEEIEEAVALVNATSPLGAFYQLLVARGEADPMMVWWGASQAAMNGAKRLRALAASALDVARRDAHDADGDTLWGHYVGAWNREVPSDF